MKFNDFDFEVKLGFIIVKYLFSCCKVNERDIMFMNE